MSYELVVDNFAGGGGASTGIRMALGRDVDIAINHDASAIAMHKINHPTAMHYQEDVWQVDPVDACAGRPVGLAWFSPDCKHFSKAKGGKPCDKNIRGLAWVAVKWAKKVHPRVIMMENVEEIQTWGPLLPNGRPDPEKMGTTYRRFIRALENLGYHVETNELVAADYGAPTTRKRWFLIARNDGRRIVWPEPTHLPRRDFGMMFELARPDAQPWVPVADVLDWSLPFPSIFGTREEIKAKYWINAVRPLHEKTLRRIALGIRRFVIDSPDPFVVNVNYSGDGGCHTLVAPSLIQYHSEKASDYVRGQKVGVPLMTVDASNRYGLVAAFLHKYYGGGYTGAGSDMRDPAPTVTAIDHNSAVCAYLTQFNNHCIGQPVTDPINTITAGQGHFGEVRAFLIKYFSGEGGSSCAEPMPTQTTKDRFGLVTVCGVDYQIVDIGLRMLTPRELFDAQGFPHDYEIEQGADGRELTKAEQVARCGNAVCPQLAEALVSANLPEMCQGAVAWFPTAITVCTVDIAPAADRAAGAGTTSKEGIAVKANLNTLDLAGKLGGNTYGNEISHELETQAKVNGLVVVFGQSDDLMEFRGAIDDEVGAFEGARVLITPNGLLKPPADGGECEERCPFFAAAAKNAVTLEALWNDDQAAGSPAWSYRTSIPHGSFRIYDEEGIYCEGIVFALSDVEGCHDEEQ